jgi:GNAT superfamily N-acetyltransferase
MAPHTFILANAVTHRDALLRINIEYMSWIASEMEKSFALSMNDLHGMPIPDYVASVIDKVCGDAPPRGAFYLLEHCGEIAGMGGLRWAREDVAEIKRIYVRPTHRGTGLGAAILQRVLGDAAAFGYRSVVLDSAPFMQSAQQLYESAGFVDRAPYAGTEVPATLHHAWRFMERPL